MAPNQCFKSQLENNTYTTRPQPNYDIIVFYFTSVYESVPVCLCVCVAVLERVGWTSSGSCQTSR